MPAEQPDLPLRTYAGVEEPPAPLTAAQAAWVIRAVATRLGEIDRVSLPLPDGRAVLVCTSDSVDEWLQGLAVRIAAGAPL
jgi:hypothetical protein